MLFSICGFLRSYWWSGGYSLLIGCVLGCFVSNVPFFLPSLLPFSHLFFLPIGFRTKSCLSKVQGDLATSESNVDELC